MKYKIVYMGTPHYAKEILDTPPVKALALEHGIDVLQPNRLSDEGIEDAIKDVNPDFIVVAAFGQILPKSILDIAPCINLHASLLPQYRGASPVQQSLLNGDGKTGVTSMLMEEGLDTGPMLEKVEFEIPSEMRLHALMSQLTFDACQLTH